MSKMSFLNAHWLPNDSQYKVLNCEVTAADNKAAQSIVPQILFFKNGGGQQIHIL